MKKTGKKGKTASTKKTVVRKTRVSTKKPVVKTPPPNREGKGLIAKTTNYVGDALREPEPETPIVLDFTPAPAPAPEPPEPPMIGPSVAPVKNSVVLSGPPEPPVVAKTAEEVKPKVAEPVKKEAEMPEPKVEVLEKKHWYDDRWLVFAIIAFTIFVFLGWWSVMPPVVNEMPVKSAATNVPAPAEEAAAPAEAPEVPEVPAVAPSIVSLNYDDKDAKGNCMTTANNPADPWTINQGAYIAFFICVANEAGDNQTDLETAISAIQDQAEKTGATTMEGNTITLNNGTAWLVWLPNASSMDYNTVPNDTAYPASLKHPALGQIWIVPPYAAGINGRTFTNPDQVFWAVALH